ncbi:MAG: carbohydrate ABC transporter permease [bacterium]
MTVQALKFNAIFWKSMKFLRALILYSICALGAVMVMIPIIWMISSSLKPAHQLFKYPIIWIPKPFMWVNYKKALSAFPFLLYTRNTLIIAISSIVGDILSCSLVAYSFARLRFPGRDILFIIVLSTTMIPGTVTLIPQFLLFKSLRLIDTYVPLILPAYLAYPIWVFFLRQFFMTIPYEMDEAALVDGAGFFRVYWQILMPLSKPALITISIFSFIHHWNNFLGPLIYLNSKNKFTVSLGLRVFQGLYLTRWEQVMAACTVALIPPLVLFVIAQKYFVRGIVMTGLKA